ncbi:MAG: hypothetical protein ABII12_04270 [Planctomycetota bacterium]
MRTILKILIAFGAIAVAWQVGQGGRAARAPSSVAADDDSATHASSDRPAVKAARRAPHVGQLRGMAIQLNGGPGVYERYRRLIPEVAELGANTVLFVVHGWQEHAGSLDLHLDARRTADAEDVGRLCDLAASRGLRTILMPIVLLSQPRNTEWRGRIIPADRAWDEWFRRYTRFAVHFAKVAERHRVDIFMVGSELIKTEVYADRWRRVIEEVRQHYRGKLGYSANWDHYQTEKIKFWDALDFVGMTSYYELAEGPNPTIEEIDANWAKIEREIKAFQREVKKPIIFTEVGWCSQEGAAHEGWNYYATQEATKAGHLEQAMLYESFLKTWADEPGVGGIIWWEWDLSPGGAKDFGYTPRGKPAERILREWFNGGGMSPAVPEKSVASDPRVGREQE